MGDALGNLRAREPALETSPHVEVELIVVTHRREGSDGDQAPIPRGEIGPPPQVVEHHRVGELHELRRDSPQFIGRRPGPCRV